MGLGGRRRRLAAAVGLALSLVLAACSSGDEAADEFGEDDIVLGDGETTTTTNGDQSLGATPKGGGGTPTTAGSRGTTTTAKGGSGATTTTARGGSATTRPTTVADSGARGGPGAYARTLLQPQRSQRIVVELLVQQGAGPGQGTLDHLARVLGEVSQKPVSITSVAIPTGDGTTTDAEVRELSDRHARTAQTGEQSVIRLLYLNGKYSPEASVLGVAVRGDTAAVFSQQVRDASTPLVSRSALEAAVSIHEIGHLLGLVDLVLSTGRQDPEHAGHSRNPDSVMYWAIESSLVGQVLSGPPPRDFDNADRADLATIRNSG